MKSFLLRPLAWMLAVLLLPACWGAALAFGKNLPAAFLLRSGSSYMPAAEGWAFIAGACAYAVWHRLAPPEFLYAFVHEFTHMAFALLTGEKVRSFEVNRGSGKVGLSGTNPIITLAPYFFPLLTIAVLILGALLDWTFGYEEIRWAVAFLSGLTLCLHVLMTLRALGASQPDIARGGRIFSWPSSFSSGSSSSAARRSSRRAGGVWRPYTASPSGAKAWMRMRCSSAWWSTSPGASDRETKRLRIAASIFPDHIRAGAGSGLRL